MYLVVIGNEEWDTINRQQMIERCSERAARQAVLHIHRDIAVASDYILFHDHVKMLSNPDRIELLDGAPDIVAEITEEANGLIEKWRRQEEKLERESRQAKEQKRLESLVRDAEYFGYRLVKKEE